MAARRTRNEGTPGDARKLRTCLSYTSIKHTVDESASMAIARQQKELAHDERARHSFAPCDLTSKKVVCQ